MTAPAYKFLPAEFADQLRKLRVSVRRPVEGGLQGLHRSPQHGASVEFADYREYTRGDPPNRIDWAVYARTDRHVIRRYQEETNLQAYILLDTSESMAYRDAGLLSKMDYACHLAAGLMFMLIQQSDTAGLTLFNDTVKKQFPLVGSLSSLGPMLLALEDIQPSGRSNIERALHTLAEQIQRRSLVVVISDLLQDPADTLCGIRHLQHNRHDVLVLHTLDATEMNLNLTGFVELEELETRTRLPVYADEIREAYAQEVQKFLDEIRRGCHGSLADYQLMDTRTPVAGALHAKFGQP